MSRKKQTRHFWKNVQITRMHASIRPREFDDGVTGDDFKIEGTERQIEKSLRSILDAVREELRDSKVEHATIWIHDYTDNPNGETIITDHFDETYADTDFDVTKADANLALEKVDPDLFVGIRDPYRNHDWSLCRMIWDDYSGKKIAHTLTHFETLAEIVAWAGDHESRDDWDEDERDEDERDAA
jgi:hypothetical protein